MACANAADWPCTFCLACLREYHTRHKMVVHLAYNSSGCRHWYHMNVQPICEDTVVDLDAKESIDNEALKVQGRGPRWAPFPTFRIPGPRPCHSAFGDDVEIMDD